MKKLLCIMSLVFFLTACEKNDNKEDVPGTDKLGGRFAGTFHRSGMDTAQVSISFDDNDHSFLGSSDKQNYPAICKGNYSINGDKLTIDNTCSWTANFDWTLIFEGEYNVNFPNDNSVRIWRTNGTTTDEYLLGRIIR